MIISYVRISYGRYGWFHHSVALSSDDIKVRWCSDAGIADEDVITDQLEIWVM